MGLFSFLKSDRPACTDKVWKTRPVAIKGMITQDLVAIKEGHVPIVFCYFDDTLTKVISFLENERVPYFNLNGETSHEATNLHKVVFVGDALAISSSQILNDFLKRISNSVQIQFLFSGHYPLLSKEQVIIKKISSYAPHSTITFCSSIDDPSFEPFGAERITDLLEKLGMKEDECIEHAMVTKAMERAREKIESKVKYEIHSRSEGEWYLKNVTK